MRIRKEISPWSFKTFLILFGILLVAYNLFYFLAGFFSDENFIDESSVYHWLIIGVANPVLLSAILTTTSRTSTLFISDYQAIADFKNKLVTKLGELRLKPVEEKYDVVHFEPTGFFSWFNNWFGTEKLTLKLHDEIIIHGSMRKISSIEDSLGWNKEFK